jgi:cytochrome c oxidase subunit 2
MNQVHRSSIGRAVLATAVTSALAFAGVACGSDDGDTSSPATGDDGAVSAVARGEQIARSSGCAGCHGADFDGGAGPSWVGLAGSEVVLADGSTIVADQDYLVRAIADPSADLLEGYSLRMPANNLSDAEIDDVVAFITSLSTDG